jgi:hypothetical protein
MDENEQMHKHLEKIRHYEGSVNDLKSVIELAIKRTEKESGIKHPIAIINQ